MPSRTPFRTLTLPLVLLALASAGLLTACSRNADPAPDGAAGPDRLVVTAAPDAAVTNAPLDVAPRVERRDATDALVPTTTDVVVRLADPGGDVQLAGPTAVSSVDGVATFDALTLSGPAGATPTLRFDAEGVSPVDAGPIVLAAGAAARLHVEGVGASQRSDVPFDVVVVLRDAAGNEAPAPQDLTITLRAETDGDGELRFAHPRTGIPTVVLPAGETRVTLRDVLFTGGGGEAGPGFRLVAETDTLDTLEPAPSDPVVSPDLVLALTTDDAALYSDGRATTGVRVTLAGTDGTPVSGVDVRLSTDLGTLLTPAGDPIDGTWVTPTDADGVVRARLRASTDVDVATLTAACPGSCTATREVTFLAEPMILRFSSDTDFDVKLPISGSPEATWRHDGGPVRTQTDFAQAITLSAGDWRVEIRGTATAFGSPGGWTGVDELDAVERWGDLGLVTLEDAFWGAGRAFTVPADLPPSVNDLEEAFRDATAFNDDVSTWDVSNVHNFKGLFRDAAAFNNGCPPSSTDCPLTWTGIGTQTDEDVDLQRVFQSNGVVTVFNQDVSSWNLERVVDTSDMFKNAEAFNNGCAPGDPSCPLTWTAIGTKADDDVDLSNMFSTSAGITTVFDQDVSSWNVAHVDDFTSMFERANAFDNGGVALDWTDVGTQATEDVKMPYMFKNAATASPTSFNQDVSNWNVAHVYDFTSMFERADAFDNGGVALDWTDVGTQATQDVKMAFFVKAQDGAPSPFAQSVATWRFGGVDDLTDAFRYAPNFDDDLAHWCIEPSAGNDNFVESGAPLDTFPGRLPTWDCVSDAAPEVTATATSSRVDVQVTSPTEWATAELTVSGYEATWTTATSPTEWPAWTSLGAGASGTIDLTVTGVDHRVRVRGVFVSGGEARYAVPTTTDVVVPSP